MPVLAAYAVPHPPILIPEIGHGEERKIARTTQAYEQIACLAAAHHPDVLIVISPHATTYADYFHLSGGTGASGSLAKFSAAEISLQTPYDEELVKRIELIARRWHLPAGTMGEREKTLDHGTLIPLLFLQKAGITCPVVRIGLSGLSTLSHYHLGQCVADAVNELNRRAVVIASGDLSHKLTADGPYGLSPDGAVFDRQLTDAFASGDFLSMLRIAPELADSAAECGWRSFQIMAGTLDQKSVQPSVLSYEGPFGVGYCVAAFEVTGSDYHRAFGDQFEQENLQNLRHLKAKEDPWVQLARLSLETFVRTEKRAKLPENLPPELLHIRAGAFVSLKKDGRLRGCIGTTAATADSLAAEIMRNAIAAGTNDPRFEPVREDELDDLVYSVDVLGPTEKIATIQELDPKKYGVLVRDGSRSGLLLPNLEGVHTVEQQVDIARQKAGISSHEPVKLYRFEVVRHH